MFKKYLIILPLLTIKNIFNYYNNFVLRVHYFIILKRIHCY